MTTEFHSGQILEVTSNDLTSAEGAGTYYIPENSTLSLPESASVRKEDGTAHFFQSCVVAIGCVGALGNVTVLLLLLSFEHRSKHTTNTLIMNQTAIDFMACLFLIVTYVGKLGNRVLVGYWGLVYCRFIDSAQLVTAMLHASTTSLIIMSLERYAKIVHPVWHKNNYRRWMTHVGMIFPWIYGFLLTFPISWVTTYIDGGICYPVASWPSTFWRNAYAFMTIVWKYLLPLVVFVYCYSRILHRIRQQGKVRMGPMQNSRRGGKEAAAAGESGGGGGAAPTVPGGSGGGGQSTQGPMTRTERNILKTLIIVVGCFFAFWSPLQVYYLLVNLDLSVSLTSYVYYLTIFFVYFTVCVNPLVYAVKYELLRKSVNGMIRRTRQAATEVTTATTDSVSNVFAVRPTNTNQQQF